MSKSEFKLSSSLLHLEALKEDFLAWQQEALQREHKERMEKRAGRCSTILPDCEPDCPACAELSKLSELGRRIRAYERKLNALSARSHILAALKRGKLGGDAKRARSFSGVIDEELERRINAGVRNLDWDRIQTVLRSQAVADIERGKSPPDSLVCPAFRAEVEKAIAAVKARPGYPVKVETKWLRLPSQSAIEKRRARLNKIRKT